MRVIDADYITEGRVSNDSVVIAAKCAPTIDAIPVDWLEKKLHEGYHRMCVKAVLDMWQKEQEAQE